MRHFWVFLFLAFAVRAADWKAGEPKSLGTLPGGATVWERTWSAGEFPTLIKAIVFRASDYEVLVIDNPGESPKRLVQAVPEAGAVAGINASYFHPDGRPLGLVVANSQVIHQKERAKLLSGIFAARKGRLELVRSGEFRMGDDVANAVQAGPWLVENGKPVPGLDATRKARRSILASNGKGAWMFLATTSLTLAEVADLLSQSSPSGYFEVQDALNLDGGSSTALWAKGTSVSIPEFGTVRNFLAIRPKDQH